MLLTIATLAFVLNANFGAEPFHLKVSTDTSNEVRGEVCISIVETEKNERIVDPIIYSKSCWIAEQQAKRNFRFYPLIPSGEYSVTLWLNGKIAAIPQVLRIMCSEYGNNSNQSRCPDSMMDEDDFGR